jgi:hypothetical protein
MTILEHDRPGGVLTCPLCHRALGTLTEETLAADGGCQCGTCGQRWTLQRLATVAAYADWDLNRTTLVPSPRSASR